MARLATADLGGSGRPLLLLHGAGGNLAAWAPVADQLSARWHVYGVDLAGHGRSPVLEAWTWDAMVEDVAEVIDTVTGPDVALVGHSLGGMLAWLLADRSPAPVAVVNIDGWIGPPLPDVWASQGARVAGYAAAAVRAVEALPPDVRRTALLETTTGWDPAAATAAVERMVTAAGVLRPSSTETEALYGGITDPGLESAIELAGCPLGVVLAAYSDALPWATEREVAEHVAGRAELHTRLRRRLGNHGYRCVAAGHDAPMTHPREVADLVLDLLDDLLAHRVVEVAG